MPAKYYLTDLDGTLLRQNATVSEFSRTVLAEAMKRGAVISYATARGYTSSSKAAAGIPWAFPLVLYNGAMILDPASMKVLGGYWLDTERTNEVIRLGGRFGLAPFLFALDPGDKERVLHEKLHRTGDLQFHQSRPGDPRFQEVKQLECPESYRALILTYIGLEEELKPLKQEAEALFGSRLHIHMMKDSYIKDHYFLEMGHPMANKREGIFLWSKLVGCDPSEVTAFGDNLNDIGLLEGAGRRIAVANAHPDIIRRAHYVTASHEEDGVARFIKADMNMEG